MSDSPREFNADKRAKEREQADITIDGGKYKPARRTTGVMRELRRLTRADNELVQQSKKLDEEADDYAARQEALDADRERLVYEMTALLLTPSNGNPAPTAEQLAEVLDFEDAGDLLDFLTPGSEKDPTAEGSTETAATTS
jgi:hypothetical protein